MAKWICFAIAMLFFLPNIGGINNGNKNDEMLVSIYPLKPAKSYATHVSIPFVIEIKNEEFVSLSKNENSFRFRYTIEWGDGSIPQIIFTNRQSIEIQHTYKKEGFYEIVVKVHDSETNEEGRASYKVKIVNALENEKPIVVMNIPSTGYVNEIVILDASQSYDPNGVIVNYTWYLGNGDVAYGEKVLYTYKQEGKYVIKLVVTDNDGNKATRIGYIEIKQRDNQEMPTGGGIDQSQEKEDGFFKIYKRKAYAQSFRPQKYLRLLGIELLIGKKTIFSSDNTVTSLSSMKKVRRVGNLLARILSLVRTKKLNRITVNKNIASGNCINPVPAGLIMDMLVIQFYDDLYGLDDPNFIAWVGISPRDVPEKGWYYFDLGSLNYIVDFDREYYVVVSHANARGNERNYYKLYYGDNDPYANGSAYMWTGSGWTELNKDICFRTYGEYTGDEPDGVVKHWALVVGCEHYTGQDDAKYAISSAESVAFELSESGWSVSLLRDATADEIVNGLEEIAKKEDMDDVVLFYFSGHGSAAPNLTNPSQYDEAFIMASDGFDLGTQPQLGRYNLVHIFDSMFSEHIVLIFDSCHSGAFITAKYNLAKEGRIILASCREDESAWAKDSLRSGVFTYYLVQGLKGRADGEDGYAKNGEVSAEEAFAYAERYTLNTPLKKPQHPQMYDGIPGEVTLTKV